MTIQRYDAKGWGISQGTAEVLAAICKDTPPMRVLDLGCAPGVSTLTLSESCPNGCRVYAVESDRSMLEEAKLRVQAHKPGAAVTWIWAPMGRVHKFGSEFPWYSAGPMKDVPSGLDLVLVDGKSRQWALPMLWHLLSRNAIVLMDDARRDGEAVAFAKWKEYAARRGATFSWRLEGTDRGLAVLKLGDAAPLPARTAVPVERPDSAPVGSAVPIAEPTRECPDDRVLCVMRVKNERANIAEAVASVLPLCGRALIMDDNSTDETPEIIHSFAPRAEMLPSPFKGLDESRDKNWLLENALVRKPSWILWIDGDEALEGAGCAALRALVDHPSETRTYSLRIAYLWDALDRVRVDGRYGQFKRPSFFRIDGLDTRSLSFPTGCSSANFHCGNVPQGIPGPQAVTNIRLKHYGYMNAAERKRKYEWYNRIDPNNETEDRYRHLVGLPGARYAPGPPRFESWYRR